MNPSEQRSPRRSLQRSPEADASNDWAPELTMSPLANGLSDLHDWNTYPAYSPMMGSPMDLNGPLYTLEDSFLDANVVSDDQQNALGLSLPEEPSSPHVSDTLGYHTMPQVQPPTPRNTLPQINTAHLHPSDSLYHHSPIEQSPYGYTSQPPLSASASTPSSTGHRSVPWTPAQLPHTPLYYFPTTPGGLLSPHPVHSACYPPAPSPSSPSPSLMVTSPTSTTATPPGALTSVPTVVELASRFPFADLIVPQRLYRPNTQSDRRRYVEEVVLEQPIMFYSASGEACGIRCSDALCSRFASLFGRDDAMFEQRGPSVSIRLMWPGYAPWSRQIPTRDFRSPPQPITRAKLAKNVAKTIKRFIEDMENKPMEDDANPHYRVGRKHISIDDLELVGLQHVSMGSWQAHVRLNRRR